MVFETVLIEVVNKYIGSYVENLNADQLKVGIWGGNVVVENLAIRPGAFDDLDLPVKTVFGHLGKLTLQIPWKDLYNSPVKVEVERLYVLIVPNSDIKYDPVKDKKYRQDEKMAEVKKVEKAKQLEKERALPKQAEPSSFVEKLTANIIKNVQITLKDIHIRFEDKFSNPVNPYAAGITLDLFQVTSIARWGDDVPVDPVSLVFKQLVISSFSVYWNPCSGGKLYSANPSTCIKLFKGRLENKPQKGDFNYMLGPINSTTLLRYNKKPEEQQANFTVPKWFLVSDFKELSFGINKSQFQDIMSFVEGLEMMRRAGLYRKYRPNVPSYRGYYKQWWKFAYTCVVEEEVKRKLKNWDPKQIHEHCQNVKAYREAYKQKMMAPNKKPTSAQIRACEDLEEKLDALNIILARQQVEVKLERSPEPKEEPVKSGWFGGWWGGSSSKDDSSSTSSDEKLMDKLGNAMSSEEKNKLYKAIGYQEGDVPLEYPETFVEFCLVFTLDTLSINVFDDSVPQKVKRAMCLQLNGVRTEVGKRPTSMTASTCVRMFNVAGTEQNSVIPQLVSTYNCGIQIKEPDTPGGSVTPNLLELCFDQNPLDSGSDMRVSLKAQPLLVTFDAKTINDLRAIFDTSKPIAANQIQQAVQMKMNEIKTMSATGLQHMVTERKIVEIDVDLQASTLILPENGFYKKNEGSLLVFSLGHFKVSSNPQDRDQVMTEGLAEKESPNFTKLLEKCYDKYEIQLTDLQIVYAMQGEEWEGSKTSIPDMMYFLKPSSLTVEVKKCIIQDDPRIPQFKLNGSLNCIDIILSEKRLKDFFRLMVSIPLGPAEAPPAVLSIDEAPIFDSTLSMTAALNQEAHRDRRVTRASTEDVHQFKELELEFKIHQITASIVDEEEILFIYFNLHSLGVTVTKNTFDHHIIAELGGILLKQNYLNKIIHIIDTPASNDKQYLICVEMIVVDRKCPEFRTTYGSTLQTITIDFTQMEVCAHAEAILDLLQRTNEFSKILENRPAMIVHEPTFAKAQSRGSARTLSKNVTLVGSKSGKSVSSGGSAKSRQADVVDMRLNVNVEGISIKLQNCRKSIMRLAVKGGDTSIVLRKAYTQLTFNLKGIEVTNLESSNMYSKVISQVDENVAFRASIVIFNNEIERTNTNDMKIKAEVARLRMVFIHSFITSVLDFLDNFQTAQQKVLEASQAAAEVAKQNVQEAYSNAAKAELNLDLKAPVIYVPINESVRDVFIINLGELVVTNTIVEINCKDSQVAALDRIKLVLDDVKLTKACINEDFSIITDNSCEIIERVSFKLTVQRNLSSGWYTDIPDLELHAEIPSIMIHLNRKNYLSLMRMLEENIGAPTSPNKDSVVKAPSEFKGSRAEPSGSGLSYSSKVASGTAISTIREVDEPAEPELDIAHSAKPPPLVIRTSVKFRFSLESVVIDVGLPSDVVSPDLLGKMTLLNLSLRGSLLTDGSINTSILLADLSLDDLRGSREGKISCYMSRKDNAGIDAKETTSAVVGTSDPVVKNVLDVVYSKSDNNTFAEVRISSFLLILNVEYLAQIASVFATPPVKTDVPAQKRKKQPAPSVSSMATKPSKASVMSRASPPPPETPSNAVLNFNFKCEQPDIILVEHMDNVDTSALILHAEIVVKGRIQDDKQFISGSITDLQVFSCCFNPMRRRKTKVPVLHPFSVILAGCTPEQPGLNLDVCTTAINLSVSPGTISLLSNISSAMAVRVDVDESMSVYETDRSKMWDEEPINETEYHFLQTKLGEEALDVFEYPPLTFDDDDAASNKLDTCSLTVPEIVITLESGGGKNTMPLFKLESKIQATIRQWSSQPTVDANLRVQMSYYNYHLALWEPVLEPVETNDIDGKDTFIPWELKLQLETTKDFSLEDTIESPDGEAPEPHSLKKIVVSSKDSMPVTITKTCFHIITDLGAVFQAAYYRPSEFEGEKPSYIFKNDTGYDVLVRLEQSKFKVWGFEDSNALEEAMVVHGETLQLQSTLPSNTIDKDSQALQIYIPEWTFSTKLPIAKAEKRYFQTPLRGASNDFIGILSDVSVENGCTTITLRSIIQIRNKFSVPISVYYMTKKGNELELVGVIEPKGVLNLPVDNTYTPTCELFFSVQDYSVSLQPFVWKDLQKSLAKSIVLRCDPKTAEEKEPFFMRASGELEQVYFENTNRHTMASACYNINVRPTVIFKNLLPVDVVCSIQGMVKEPLVSKGGHTQIHTAEPGFSTIVVRIPDYLNREWVCKHLIEDEGPELAVWTFETYESPQRFTLELGLHTLKINETVIMELYCPFWMLNKTGLLLSYKLAHSSEHVLYHPADFVGPIMFSFRAKSFFAKKKSQVRVESGSWSDKFSLDVVGSSGSVSSTNKGMKYEIGVSIQLSYSTFTKIVVFTPFYVVLNQWPIDLEFQEVNAHPTVSDPWVTVPKGGCCVPFWPVEKQHHSMKVRVKGTSETTVEFPYNVVFNGLFKLENRYGAINVDVQVTEGGTYIAFHIYENGLAPALILNNTELDIQFEEKAPKKEASSKFTLKSHHRKLFTWNSGAIDNELLVGKTRLSEIKFKQDNLGKMDIVGKGTIYWVSFLFGLQRVLLFTPYQSIAKEAQQLNGNDVVSSEIEIQINGISLSLVDNINKVEVLHMGIAGTQGAVWQSRKKGKRRFKPLTDRESAAIETVYQEYVEAQSVPGNYQAVSGPVKVDNRTVVDFGAMTMVRPSHRELKRAHKNGLWASVVSSNHTLQVHIKINRVQIDNQMFDCVFPVVLAPVPLPKTIIDVAEKPFIEVSVVKRLTDYSVVQQYKYFKVLVQEFQIKVDTGFISAMISLFEKDESYNEKAEETGFMNDLNLKDTPLQDHVSSVAIQDQKHFYDYLHLSPLKFHLSFTLSGTTDATNTAFVGTLLQSFGVTLTDIQGVVFKLAYFEKEHTFLTRRQLMSEVQRHYTSQLIKQLYVLVFGLDVIGNPLGLMVGIGHGAKDLFYEPFQGAIQGPGEFATGLAYGMRSLLGHTVGGAAGAVSKITGAMGKGLAVLTFDKEYQKNRLEMYSQQPANLQEGLAQSGKGLVMGMYHGVTGVVTKPITGAKEDGVKGFFAGAGKGLVGLVTRPTAGIVDFASGSFNAVKRATDLSCETTRIRPPRFIQNDGHIRPFSKRVAEGYKLLKDVDKGKYATTDMYVFHTAIGQQGQDFLLLTDKRIGYVCVNEIFGGFQMDWSHTWNELESTPTMVPNGINLPIGKKKGMRAVFQSSPQSKILLIDSLQTKKQIINIATDFMQEALGTSSASLVTPSEENPIIEEAKYRRRKVAHAAAKHQEAQKRKKSKAHRDTVANVESTEPRKSKAAPHRDTVANAESTEARKSKAAQHRDTVANVESTEVRKGKVASNRETVSNFEPPEEKKQANSSSKK